MNTILKAFDAKFCPCRTCTTAQECAPVSIDCRSFVRHKLKRDFLQSSLEKVAREAVKSYDEELVLKSIFALANEDGTTFQEARKSALQKRGIEE